MATEPNMHGSAPDPTKSSPEQVQPVRATPNQRIGLAVLSLISLVFLLNIIAALARDLGPTAVTVSLAAVCLVVLGINIAFNLDLLHSR